MTRVAAPRFPAMLEVESPHVMDLLQMRERELEAVEAVGRAISDVLSASQIDTMLDVVVGRAKELVQADIATLDLLDAAGCQVVRGSSGIRTEAHRRLRIPNGVGVDGAVIASGRPKRVSEYATDPSITHELNEVVVVGEGVRSCMAVPFFLDGRVAGTLNVARRTPAPFSEQDETLLARLATQATVAVKIARLCQEVRELEGERAEQLHERLIGIARAKEAERKRIARELHDDLGQTLSGLVVNLEASRGRPGVSEEVERSLEACVAAARGALRSVRAWLGELRIPWLESIDLAVVLRDDLLPAFEAESGCGVRLEVCGWPADLPGEVTFQLYRVIQESLANVRRHARATRVSVRLAVVGDGLTVTIADDGIGFTPCQPGASATGAAAGTTAPGSAVGFGLIGMRERAALLGGELHVEPTPGGGTTVRLTIPLDWWRSPHTRACRRGRW